MNLQQPLTTPVVKADDSRKSILKIAGVFLASRALIAIGFLLAGNLWVVKGVKLAYRLLFNSPNPAGTQFAIHPFAYEPAAHSIAQVARYWDGLWYLNIATQGYYYDGTLLHRTIAHYPFFALLSLVGARLGMAFGVPPETAILWSGVLLSNLSFLVALLLLFPIVKKYAGSQVAFSAVTLLAFYPGSLFCATFLTEGSFLAVTLGFFYALEFARPGLAAILSVPASLTRLNGAVLIVPFVQRFGLGHWKKWIWFSVILLGIVLYPLFLYGALGDPLIYFKLHSGYRGEMPVKKIVALIGLLFAVMALYADTGFMRQHRPAFLKRIAGIVLRLLPFVVLAFYGVSLLALLGKTGIASKLQQVIPVFEIPVLAATAFAMVVFGLYQHLLPREYKTYTMLNFFPLLFSGTFFSNHRYLVIIFPLFWMLAEGLKEYPRIRYIFYGGFGGLLLGLAVLYISMGWLFLF